MRTTVDLPDELLRALKVAAAQRGETLKEILTRAVSREVATVAGADIRQRVALPLISGAGRPAVHVTSDDIAAALAADDERYAG